MSFPMIDSGVLDSLFGACVGTAVACGPPSGERPPWPEEERALGTVSLRRRLDFVRGRQCAAHAIAALGGCEPGPVGIGSDRAPRWPDGLVGSITHTEGLAACAVARTGTTRAIGLDAEPDLPLPSDVLSLVANSRERAACEVGSAEGRPDAGRLLFCVKEATYKAWYPLTNAWLGFEDVSVFFDHERSRFTVELLVDGPVRRFAGRYAKVGLHVVAAIEVLR